MGGESKIELRKSKPKHRYFLISFKGGITAKYNDAEVGMSLFFSGGNNFSFYHIFSSILIGLYLSVRNLGNSKPNSLLSL